MAERRVPKLEYFVEIFEANLSDDPNHVAVPFSTMQKAVRKRFNTNNRLAHVWLSDLATADDPPLVIIGGSSSAQPLTRTPRWEELRKHSYNYPRAYQFPSPDGDPREWSRRPYLDRAGRITTVTNRADASFVLTPAGLADLVKRHEADEKAAAKRNREKAETTESTVRTAHGDGVDALLGLLAAAGADNVWTEVGYSHMDGKPTLDRPDLNRFSISLANEDIDRVGALLRKLGVTPAPWEKTPAPWESRNQ